jgi:hypothetical protein
VLLAILEVTVAVKLVAPLVITAQNAAKYSNPVWAWSANGVILPHVFPPGELSAIVKVGTPLAAAVHPITSKFPGITLARVTDCEDVLPVLLLAAPLT